jgi:hypothetical protein
MNARYRSAQCMLARFQSALWFAATLLLFIDGGHAATREQFKHEITATRATSRCIGNIKEPLCALDTHLACTVKDLGDICPKVGVRRKWDSERPTFIRYSVVRQGKWAEPPAVPGFNDPSTYQGIELDVRKVTCFGPPKRRCFDPWIYTYRLTWDDGGWNVEIPHDEDFGDTE